MKLLNEQELEEYAARVRAMSDAVYEQEVTHVTDLAAHCSVYGREDQKATVLYRDHKHRENGLDLYSRGHRRMVGGVMIERAAARALVFVETGA